jgi:hypothetical protein
VISEELNEHQDEDSPIRKKLTENIVVNLIQTTSVTHEHRLFSWRDSIKPIVIGIVTVQEHLPFFKANR